MTILLFCNDLKFILQSLETSVSYGLNRDFKRYMVIIFDEIEKKPDNRKIIAILLFADFPNSCMAHHLRVVDSEIVNFAKYHTCHRNRSIKTETLFLIKLS
jgi:hypothetical protein